MSRSDPTQLAIPARVEIIRPPASAYVLDAARKAHADIAAIERMKRERAIRARSRGQLLVVVARAVGRRP